MGLAHMTIEAWLIWIKDMEASAFDFTFFENSPRFPRHLFENPMQKQTHVISLAVGPEMLGWPVRQTRLFSCAINRSSLVWCGPSTNGKAAAHFNDFFLRRAMVDANVLAHSNTPATVTKEREARGREAGLSGPLADGLVI